MRFDVVVRYWEQAGGKRRSFEAPYAVEADSASDAVARAKDRFDELDRETWASESRGIEAIEVLFESSGDPSRWTLEAPRSQPAPPSSAAAPCSDDPPSPAPRRRRTDA